ncbi:hypothetical protein NC652_020999 [Populus alba x Populus x berolinensis]|nr:hypothetical protein NC652_020999 [Populus alba x Populus x berolinensis]
MKAGVAVSCKLLIHPLYLPSQIEHQSFVGATEILFKHTHKQGVLYVMLPQLTCSLLHHSLKSLQGAAFHPNPNTLFINCTRNVTHLKVFTANEPCLF